MSIIFLNFLNKMYTIYHVLLPIINYLSSILQWQQCNTAICDTSGLFIFWSVSMDLLGNNHKKTDLM